MATLALSLAGQMVGGALGGPIGATIGRALGGLAGSAIDGAVFGSRSVAGGSDIRLTGSSEGGAIARVYGWCRVAGNIIWASELERVSGESAGAKATGAGGEAEIVTGSFAVALCEGEVAHLGRIWADGRVLETEGLSIRFYKGTTDQQPDGFILAKQGEAPAYRGLCYLVFEQLDLSPFGNRVPNISVEVCRPVGDLEPQIRAMCLIPGSTEFGYDPSPRVRVVRKGETAPENTHLSAERSDWDLSIDELLALCPNLRHVGLVVAWFGTDLRCGECVVEPRVEARTRQVEGASWSVAGRTRGDAALVSRHGDGPAYGGTPSDASVRAAITDLKRRGISVTLYPFVMMDIPYDNGLPDPFSGATRQPPYPWRGRVTCHPAPGRPGTPDGSAEAAAQVSAFMANGYRAMIRHYAQLASDAGGVEAILIGSEMRHLTWVRSGATQFPFVDALRTLAAEVRAIVGNATKITYAADWSEYSGLQPDNAPGDKIFHLDPLWADANIDAVGIDNYMPLSDWREGSGHADAGVARSVYDLHYLRANIAGGEGFDWFYASDDDRAAQVRTPIGDGAHGEAWIWRYKDLVNWWSQPHHYRIGGVRSATPTAWVPQAKPIWMTEFGCGAVDKGTNGPNAFGDPKSAEDKRPPFSSGAPDPLIQRQALRAFHQHWRAVGPHNPVSGVYGGRMVDVERLYLWCWDARPFPAFPAMSEVWADAKNYPTGHWLNGRLGTASIGEMLATMAADHGVATGRIDAVTPLVTGFGVEVIASLRDVTEPLAEAGGLSIRDGLGAIEWIEPDTRDARAIAQSDLVRGDGAILSRKRGDPSERVARLTLGYFDRDTDYRKASVLAVAPDGERHMGVEPGLVLGGDEARRSAEMGLMRQRHGTDRVEMALPPSRLAVEPGDLLAIGGISGNPFRVEDLRDGLERRVTAGAHADPAAVTVPPQARRWSVVQPPVLARPDVLIAHLPDGDGGSELVAAAYAQPWPGSIQLRDGATGLALGTITARGAIGRLVAPLARGHVAVWDRSGVLDIELASGHLASVPEGAVLAAANSIAVLTDAGWEIIGFANAELVGTGRYRLTRLLRGQRGTLAGTAQAEAPVMVLNAACARMAVEPAMIGGTTTVTAYAGPRDVQGTTIAVPVDVGAELPLPPVHLRARRLAGGAIGLDWIRQGRVGGGDWAYGDIALDHMPERYRLTVFDGAVEKRSVEVSAAEWVYSSADQALDFGGSPSGFAFGVQQISAVLGPGHRAMGRFA